MSKLTKNYEQLAVETGLRFDAARNVLYGQRDGFALIVYAANPGYPYILTISVSAKSFMRDMDKAETKQFARQEKTVVSLNQDGNVIKMVLRNMQNQKKLREYVTNGINMLIPYLKGRGFVPCCQFCGQEAESAAYDVGGEYMQLCPDCAGRLRQDITLAAKQKQKKRENIIGGIVGAFLGSVIGILCIVILGQMNRVAVLSGIVMAICTIKGYELLGGKLTKKGVAISVVMMIVMTYLGSCIDWGITIARELDTDIFTGVELIPELLAMGVIEKASYIYNLVLLYVFTLVGVVPTIYASLQQRKQESSFGQIGATNIY